MPVSLETALPVSNPHPHTHCFFLETFAHLHSHTETCTALSSSHRSQISTKYRRWCRAIGSCQMRPHYQALVFVHNNQPLHLFLCLAFSTHGHSGQTKYSRALPLGLSLLPHATPLCTPPTPPLNLSFGANEVRWPALPPELHALSSHPLL